MSRFAAFHRQRKPSLFIWFRRWQTSPPPWLPLVALVGVAAVLFAVVTIHSRSFDWSISLGLEHFQSKPEPAAVSPRFAAARRSGPDMRPAIQIESLHASTQTETTPGGTFRLCAGFYQRNCVIDGDTIRHDGIKIRLADIDTPETHEPKCASEAELGRKATRRMLELINAGPFDVVRSGSRDEDAYGRKLRIIARDGRSLGNVLIAEGLARRWDGARRGWCG